MAWPCFPVLEVDISTILHGRPLSTTKPFLRRAEHCIGYVLEAPASPVVKSISSAMVGWADGSFPEGTTQKVCLLFNRHTGKETSHFGQVTCQASQINYFCIDKITTKEEWTLSNSGLYKLFHTLMGRWVGSPRGVRWSGGYPPWVLTRTRSSKFPVPVVPPQEKPATFPHRAAPPGPPPPPRSPLRGSSPGRTPPRRLGITGPGRQAPGPRASGAHSGPALRCSSHGLSDAQLSSQHPRPGTAPHGP